MVIRGAAVAALALAALATPAAAQSPTCPAVASQPNFPQAGGNVFGAVSQQWRAWFGAKADANNGVLCNPTIAGIANLSINTLNVLGTLYVDSYPLTLGGALATVGPLSFGPLATPNATLYVPTPGAVGTVGPGGAGTVYTSNGASSPPSFQPAPTATTVANTAALRAASTATYPNGVVRLTDGAAGAPPLAFGVGSGPCATDDGASCVDSSDGNQWDGVFSGPADVREWGAIDVGVGNATGTDSSVQLAAALSWCGTHPGNSVSLGSGRFVSDATLDIPQYCTLAATAIPNPANNANGTQSILQQPGAVLLGPGDTLNVVGGTQNVSVFPAGLLPPTSYTDYWTKKTAFAGTGVTVPGTSAAPLSDAQMRDVFVVGFNQCIDSEWAARTTVDHAWLDCTNGLNVDNSHDVAAVSHVRGWEWFGGASGYDQSASTVTGVADNGSGSIRLAVSATANFATGETLTVTGVGGALGANGQWVVTVVDATHVDLQGSTFSGPAVVATFGSGAYYVTVPSVAGIYQGMAVSGVGIPGGDAVLTVDPFEDAVWLTNATTLAGPQTLTFANGAYTSGGTATLYNATRAGAFVSVTNSEENNFSDTFEFGYAVGYSVGAGTQWELFDQAGCDDYQQNRTTVCFDISGGTDTNWNGGISTAGIVPLVTSGTEQNVLVDGVTWEMTPVGENNFGASIGNLADNLSISAYAKKPVGQSTYIADYHASPTVYHEWIEPTLPQWVMLPVYAVSGGSAGNTTGGAVPQVLLVRTSWTPALAFVTPGTGTTYSTQVGSYLLSPSGTADVSFGIQLSALGSDAGAVYLKLPFPCLNTRDDWGDGTTVGYLLTGASSPLLGGFSQAGSITTYDVAPVLQFASSTSNPILASNLTNTTILNGTLRCRIR